MKTFVPIIFIYLLMTLRLGAQTDMRPVQLPQLENRPNIVIVLVDDLDAFFTPQYFPEVLPVIDSLKKIGIDFANSFTPMSICCPSRSATLTGTYAHTNGVYRNQSTNGGWKAFAHNEPYTMPAHLQKSMIGKYLNGYGDDKKATKPVYGWTDASVFSNYFIYKGYDYEMIEWEGGKPINDTVWSVTKQEFKQYGHAEEDYSTDMVGRKAKTFLDNAETNDAQPFFMYLTPTAPHFPLQPPPRYQQKTEERWAKTPLPTRPNVANDYGKLATAAEEKVPLDKSSWLRNTWEKRVRQLDKGVGYYNKLFKGHVPRSIKSLVQAEWYSRMGSLYALNDFVRNLIAELKKKGEWDNTLLVFTSDNGYMLGVHSMLQKGNPYEESIHVPMVIAGGEGLHLREPGKTEEWVTNLDIMPTVLELAGVEVPENIEGISLVPLLQTEEVTQIRDRFVMEYIGPGMAVSWLAYHPKWAMKKLPVYGLDQPTFNAIRMKMMVTVDGKQQEQIFKYIEWQKHPVRKVMKFSDKYRLHDPKLMAKVAQGGKKILKLKAKAEEVETELYNITEDPYEMDNLLYYKPEEYKDLAARLKAAMEEIIPED